jgi:hypothetical protein
MDVDLNVDESTRRVNFEATDSRFTSRFAATHIAPAGVPSWIFPSECCNK